MSQKKWSFVLLLIVSLGALLLFSSCALYNQSSIEALIGTDETFDKTDVLTYSIVDDESIYIHDLDNQVEVIYIAVGSNTDVNGNTNDWTLLNKQFIDDDKEKIVCDALVQFGNETAPTEGKFGYGEVISNATIRLQGKKASTRQQKNYRIDIKKESGTYNGLKSFILSKSFSDPFRISQCVCNDLMETIPDMFSNRSQLVHLYVKDTTIDDSKYYDYGLYTLYEPVNKTYFKQRQLDDDGEMYKVENFDFGRHEDIIRLNTDPGYNSEAFETLLEEKGDGDHSLLIEMLDAVNDYSIPIEDTVKKYFDKDNLYSYIAFQLLTGQYSKSCEDFFLYNPRGTTKFYFISSKDDAALREDYETLRNPNGVPGWKKGVSGFCNNKLFSRIFLSDVCISNLSEKVDLLFEKYLSPDLVGEMIKDYSAITKHLVYSFPDSIYARVTEEDYTELIEKIPDRIEQNYYLYYDSLDKSQPFNLNEPVVDENDKLKLLWTESLSKKDVQYTLKVDDSWSFDSPLYVKEGITDTEVVIDMLEPGQYFFSVTATSNDSHEMIAYETYSTEQKSKIYGVLCFYVFKNGDVKASWFNGEE